MSVIKILLIPILPFLSFLVLGLIGRKAKGYWSGILGIAMQLLSFILSCNVAFNYFTLHAGQILVPLNFDWLPFGNGLVIRLGTMIDSISAMMLLIVTFISLMVHLFSFSYMKGEDRFSTYYGFLGLFTFSMLGLVLSSNLFQIYMFWELVGVSSFLLIGFFYQKSTALAAAKKAFIVTRFADLGFLIGILIISNFSGSLDFHAIIKALTMNGPVLQNAQAVSFLGISGITWGLLLIFIGAAGKSAMFPLHIWLPDAMEGPTPVSALIHAATMVVAGVFLIARLFPIYALSGSWALNYIDDIGAFTALFAAVIAITQTDIKRVLAYSTLSQIGYMMFALGVSGYEGQAGLGYTASMFHLFTHALFKALLFLGAGSVIHFVHSNEMKDMGGLRKLMPVTHITFLIGCLAIAGIPPFAGFFSKEAILTAAWERNRPIYWIALFTSGLTAFYMFRLYFSIFWRKNFQNQEHQHSEGNLFLLLPLILLSVGSITAGFIPFGQFVNPNGYPIAIPFHLSFALAPISLALLGILLAAWFYGKENSRPAFAAKNFGIIYKLALHKFYIDEAWLFLTKKIIFNMIGKPASWVDRFIVDATVKNIGSATQWTSEKIKSLQSGKVQQYGMAFLAGVIIIVAYFLLKG